MMVIINLITKNATRDGSRYLIIRLDGDVKHCVTAFL